MMQLIIGARATQAAMMRRVATRTTTAALMVVMEEGATAADVAGAAVAIRNEWPGRGPAIQRYAVADLEAALLVSTSTCKTYYVLV